MDVSNFRLENLTEENEKGVQRLLHQRKYVTSMPNSDLMLPIQILRRKQIGELVSPITENSFCKVLTRNGHVLGIIRAEKSIWDTEHFGFGLGKIRYATVSNTLFAKKAASAPDTLIKACISWMKRNEVKCIITRVDLDDNLDIATYKRNGFHPFDFLITFHLNLDDIDAPEDSSSSGFVNIRPSCVKDERKLMEIARTAFKNDHFHRDFRFPKYMSDELFAKWAYNCCRGLVDIVLVATMDDGEPVGFVACKIEGTQGGLRYGYIELISVSLTHQRRGIGTLLVREAVKWFAENGVRSVFVGTQADNEPSIKTYGKVGFKSVRIEATLHKWLEG